jgi:hypothetical protein
MRRWGIDPHAAAPADHQVTPPLPPTRSAEQQNLVMSAGAPSFVPLSFDDPIELQLKELRLQQQRQKKQPKPPQHFPADHVETAQVSFDAAASTKKNVRSKHPKPSTISASAPPVTSAAVIVADDVETLSGSLDAAVSTKKNARTKHQKPSTIASGVPSAAPAVVTAGSETLSAPKSSEANSRSARDKLKKDSMCHAPAAEPKWAPGVPCMAKYAADAKFYAAEVVQVIGNTITVKFTEYENEFQTCVARDIKAAVSEGSARAQSAKVVSRNVEQAAKPQERPSSAIAQVQPKQHSRKEASLSSSSQPLRTPQLQKPPFNRKAGQDSQSAASASQVQPVQQPLQKYAKKQMPDHAQEWEKALVATDSAPTAADSPSDGVALSSVGLVAPLFAKATASHPHSQTKSLSAFDLAKMRADARAAEQLQQVRLKEKV